MNATVAAKRSTVIVSRNNNMVVGLIPPTTEPRTKGITNVVESVALMASVHPIHFAFVKERRECDAGSMILVVTIHLTCDAYWVESSGLVWRYFLHHQSHDGVDPRAEFCDFEGSFHTTWSDVSLPGKFLFQIDILFEAGWKSESVSATITTKLFYVKVSPRAKRKWFWTNPVEKMRKTRENMSA